MNVFPRFQDVGDVCTDRVTSEASAPRARRSVTERVPPLSVINSGTIYISQHTLLILFKYITLITY